LGEFNLPDEEAQREFFLFTRQFLEDRGYLHYEVANFARGKAQAGSLRYHECRHNRKYWDHTPYLGLGPTAHSFKDGRRWWNPASVAQYAAALEAGAAPVSGSEELTPEQLRLEALYLGFRTRDGVALEVIRQFPRWPAVLAQIQEAGLAQVSNDRVIATPEGLAVADRLPLLFID
jgi:oxygen-independent coproporphyrinogen-3 oxidase